MTTTPLMRAGLLLLALAPALAGAHGNAAHAGAPAASATTPLDEQHDWGRAGDPRQARRTVTLDMSDRMRFTPATVQVRLGETVRLRVKNRGAVLHELVIGTETELAAHAALMRKFPDMEHDAPYMAHVSPRRQADLVWTFNRPGTFHFGCLIPGHWEAGMRGLIEVR